MENLATIALNLGPALALLGYIIYHIRENEKRIDDMKSQMVQKWGEHEVVSTIDFKLEVLRQADEEIQRRLTSVEEKIDRLLSRPFNS